MVTAMGITMKMTITMNDDYKMTTLTMMLRTMLTTTTMTTMTIMMMTTKNINGNDR